MRLPRRVPWANIGELEQVCAWIYSDETDLDATLSAVNRLAAWKAITTLPHALDSTHSLLCVILQDNTSGQSTSYLSLRQSYANAIIRLVNGLVDPLQFGAYARSISSIATQLGLPAWLVELRHAATHEDLPSLEVLREAAREAMAWLLHNYFLPVLNPSVPTVEPPSVRPIAPLLKQYKALVKTFTRDVSLRGKYKPDFLKALRDIERWVAEAKVAAHGAFQGFDYGGESSDSTTQEDRPEKWALLKLCEALLEKGSLVPLSKRKRMIETPPFHPASSVVSLWRPLLDHLKTLHPSLPSLLANQIISHLVSTPEATPDGTSDIISLDVVESNADPSYDLCLAAWLNWLVDTWGEGEEEGELNRNEIVIGLMTGLSPARELLPAKRQIVYNSLKALCTGREELEKALAVLNATAMVAPSIKWQDEDIQMLDDRLQSTLALFPSTETQDTPDVDDSQGNAQESQLEGSALPTGWRLLRESDGWRPSPMGVFVSAI